MRKLSILFLFLLSLNVQAQKKYYFNTGWLFKSGDSIAWAEEKYLDTHWEECATGVSWQQSGSDKGTYGWYRYHLLVPRSLRTAIRETGFLKVNFGVASEAAQYFFNGRGLGQSGSLPPRFQKAALSQAVEFYISEDEINFNRINVIAIRIYSTNNSSSGLVKGPVYFYVTSSLQ